MVNLKHYFKLCITYLMMSVLCHLYVCFCIYTIDMVQAAKSSNHTVVKVFVLEYLYDIRDWIASHIDEIRYHSQPHIFLFKKNCHGQTVFYYKQWSHDDWEPSSDGHVL